MNDTAALSFALKNSERSCQGCGKCLSGSRDSIFLIATKSGHIWEFCKWYCTYTYLTRLLREKLIDTAISGSNLLKSLGATTRNWGSKIPEAELTSTIFDPIEDRREPSEGHEEADGGDAENG